ncbi:MAG: K(+)-transporting ATPase subunit F [Thermoplasmata archaeon]|jgi:K+-transporting ATPase KdpF subunit|nr:K(+)-transporting ATPase subunit F [Thermoplasmata archaeon]
MGLVSALAQNLGLTSLTVIAVALTLYLLYVMIHPEKF